MDQNGRPNETQRGKRTRTEPCSPGHAGGAAAPDRISALPDPLLLHILSFLGVKGAIATSGVARRWRYLWHSLPSLDFSASDWGGRGWATESLVRRVLVLHAGSRVELFRLFLWRHGYKAQMDAWVLFALRRGVRVLDLGYRHYHNSYFKPGVELPPGLFRCGSLEALTVRYCGLCLPSSVFLGSLKTMKLSWVHFGDDKLKLLLSGCPLLQSLTLENCNIRGNLDISAGMNRHLENLEVSDWAHPSLSRFAMQISAPSVKCLSFSGGAHRAWYGVNDLSSLVVASFRLKETDYMASGDFTAFADLLRQMCQVQVLKLCSWCLQALSAREVQKFCLSPCFNVTSMELSIGLQKWELPGIFAAFRTCNKLRTLKINIQRKKRMKFKRGFLDPYDFDETEYIRSCELSFQNVLQHLKTIKIEGFIGYEHISQIGKSTIVEDNFLDEGTAFDNYYETSDNMSTETSENMSDERSDNMSPEESENSASYDYNEEAENDGEEEDEVADGILPEEIEGGASARYDEKVINSGEEEGQAADSMSHKRETDILFIGFLLKVSPILEKLMVGTTDETNNLSNKWELLFKLSSDLLSLPRASPNAQVIINGN